MGFSLYLDEGSVNRALIRALEARGLGVTNAVDAGLVGRTDVEQLEHATAEGRVLFTYNIGDFLSLHKQLIDEGQSHGGLIVAPQQRYSVGEQMRRRSRSANLPDPRKRGEVSGRWKNSVKAREISGSRDSRQIRRARYEGSRAPSEGG